MYHLLIFVLPDYLYGDFDNGRISSGVALGDIFRKDGLRLLVEELLEVDGTPVHRFIFDYPSNEV